MKAPYSPTVALGNAIVGSINLSVIDLGAGCRLAARHDHSSLSQNLVGILVPLCDLISAIHGLSCPHL